MVAPIAQVAAAASYPALRGRTPATLPPHSGTPPTQEAAAAERYIPLSFIVVVRSLLRLRPLLLPCSPVGLCPQQAGARSQKGAAAGSYQTFGYFSKKGRSAWAGVLHPSHPFARPLYAARAIRSA